MVLGSACTEAPVEEESTPIVIPEAPPCDTVYEGDYQVFVQEDLDALSPYCKVEGNLRIEGTELLFFELPNLIEVTGDVHITLNEILTSFSLPLLHTVGNDMRIGQGYPYRSNGQMASFSLPALTRVKRDLRLMDNIALLDFEFPGLMEVGGILWVGDNSALLSFSFPALALLQSHVLVENNVKLTSLSFDALEIDGGNFWVGDNTSLETLQFPKLKEVMGIMWINNNIALKSLGLWNLTRVGESLQVTWNQALPQCLVEALMAQIAVGDGAQDKTSSGNNNIHCTCAEGSAGMEASCICDDVECPPDDDLCTQDICGVVSGEGVCYPPYSPEDDAALYCPYYDGDLDGVPAENDNCPNDSNGKQRDWDGNGTGDACATNACINTSDLEILNSASWKSMLEDAATCEKTCSESQGSGCTVAECIGESNGVSPDCAGCIAASGNCIAEQCGDTCFTEQGENEPNCALCLDAHCRGPSGECSGIGKSADAGCSNPMKRFCDNRCYPAHWWDPSRGDGTCDQALACEENAFDEGDCSTVKAGEATCPEGQIADCSGTCTLLESIVQAMGNSLCDDTLSCPAFDWDGGDCGDEVCQGPEVPDCLDGCGALPELVSTYHSEACKHSAACAMWDYDGGDCVGQCTVNPSDLFSLLSFTIEQMGVFTNDCLLSCQNAEEQGQCVNLCMADSLSVSPNCALCFSILAQCAYLECGSLCIEDHTSAECMDCTQDKCMGIVEDCTGFQFTSE